MPGPVNQVHKPKPLGEVLLLNSSQLLDFFFPSSPPLLIVNWGVLSFSREFICKRKRGKKRGSKRLLHRRRVALKKCFVTCAADPPLLSPLALRVRPSQNPRFVPPTNKALGSSKVERGAQRVWLWLRGAATTPPLMSEA